MKWVCVTRNFQNFTYGKIYEGELTNSKTTLNIINDLGYKTLPSYYSSCFERGQRYYYFLSLEEWRDKQIDKILYTKLDG